MGIEMERRSEVYFCTNKISSRDYRNISLKELSMELDEIQKLKAAYNWIMVIDPAVLKEVN